MVFQFILLLYQGSANGQCLGVSKNVTGLASLV